jgi:hypothetical protein
MDVPVRFIDSIINNPLLMQFLVHRWFFLLEYDPRLDQLRVYDTRSRTLETLDAYLGSEKPEHATIFAEDRWKMPCSPVSCTARWRCVLSRRRGCIIPGR